ncbi:pilus assembly protein PilE [Thioalkalivibrio denitrificans]|uniref:Pilus assembly protein PilE n=1 Tax=Thioalkalivibrio denitrificans TaxID=108003 RepID=A0A1V3NJ00_9GAMM|nr:type IV pilin protein [Thioalkalivibrio denitrificans]OOG24913.1 pilus assembly protein PilE [Thioalkalivibrio denitrificans]
MNQRKPRYAKRRESRGFTLIEVMIVVVILGIIAVIAYPNYTRHVQNTRMANAQGDLMELAQWMERQYTLNNAYRSAPGGPFLVTGDLPFTESPKDSNTTAYDVTLGDVTANTFTLTATPVGPQAGHWCGNLTLNQAGTRGATGADPADCWR